MAPVEWIEIGYQGVGGLSTKLVWMLLADPRFGLFPAMPIALLSFAGIWFARRGRSPVPAAEAGTCLALTVAMVLFFGTVQYTQLQWVTGIRYLAAIFPFAFLAAVPALVSLPRTLLAAVAAGSVTISWSIAMVRSQGTVFDNLRHLFLEGFQLPWLTVLGKLSTQYAPWLKGGLSPLPLFLLTAIVIWCIWRIEQPWGKPDWER
jgi:hypothetical protein